VSFIIRHNRFSCNRIFLSRTSHFDRSDIPGNSEYTGREGKFPIHPPRLKFEINYSLRSMEQVSKFCSSSTAVLRQTKLISQSAIKFKVKLKFEWDRSSRSRALNFIWNTDRNTLSGAPFLIVNRIATIRFSLRYGTFQSLSTAMDCEI